MLVDGVRDADVHHGGAPLIPGIGFLIEPIAAVVTADGRRLGDRLAGTQVIEVGDYDPEQ